MRIFLFLVLLVLISGCIASEPDEETLVEEYMNMNAISISSDVFENGGMLSSECTCDGNDVSPYLSWDTIPTGTQSIALIVDDPDAPGKTWVHWVIYNIPASSTGLPGAVPKNKTLDDGSMQGKLWRHSSICANKVRQPHTNIRIGHVPIRILNKCNKIPKNLRSFHIRFN